MADWTISPILHPQIVELIGKFSGIIIGTIGDAAHTAEASGSDHNPDQWDFVCASDAMLSTAADPSEFKAADAEALFQREVAMIRSGDKRIAYVIYNRRICSSTVQPGVIREYHGTDPHTNHVHTSVIHGSDPHPTTSWNLFPEVDMPLTKPDDDFIQGAILAYNEGGLPADLPNDANGKPANYLNYFTAMYKLVRQQAQDIVALKTEVAALTTPPPATVDEAALAEALQPLLTGIVEEAIANVLKTGVDNV